MYILLRQIQKYCKLIGLYQIISRTQVCPIVIIEFYKQQQSSNGKTPCNTAYWLWALLFPHNSFHLIFISWCDLALKKRITSLLCLVFVRLQKEYYFPLSPEPRLFILHAATTCKQCSFVQCNCILQVMSSAMSEQERCIFCLTYQDSMSDPRMLPCSHVFCLNCLEANPHTDGIECCACRWVLQRMLKALAHYKDFSEKIFVEIVVHI